MQNVTPSKLKRKFEKAKADLEAQGRKKISDYHVLNSMVTSLPVNLQPSTFGYSHGLSRKGRNVSSKDRKVALHNWTWAVACFINAGFTCYNCKGREFHLSVGVYPVSDFPKFCSQSCVFSSSEFQQKRDETCLRRYGKTLGEVVATNLKEGRTSESEQKRKSSWQASVKSRYGSLENFAAHVTARRVDTWRAKYGVSNPSQSAELFAKQNAYRVREVEIHGKVFKVQGYEDKVIRSLVVSGIRTSCIESWRKTLPTFQFRHRGKIRVYHPDLLVNKCTVVEVKSTYTLGLHISNRPKFALLKLKAAAVESAGYRFILALAANRKVYYFNSSELSIQHIRRRLNEHRTKDRSAVES